MDQAAHNNTKGLDNIVFGKIENGKYAVTTTCAPYFFFEADSEKEARDKAVRALAFYYRESHDSDSFRRPDFRPTLSRFYFEKREGLEHAA